MKKKILMCVMLILLLFTTQVSASEQNSVTFISNTFDYKPLLGFRYEISDEKGSKYFVDLTKHASEILLLPDGNYSMKEIERPKGYTQSTPVTFDLPSKTKDNVIIRHIDFYIKHAQTGKSNNSDASSETSSAQTKKTNLVVTHTTDKKTPHITGILASSKQVSTGDRILRLLISMLVISTCLLAYTLYKQKNDKGEKK